MAVPGFVTRLHGAVPKRLHVLRMGTAMGAGIRHDCRYCGASPVRGAIPGANGGLVEVKRSVKGAK